MNIQPVRFYTANYNSNNKVQTAPNFKAASDLTLQYMLKKHQGLMPESVLAEVKRLCAEHVKNMPTLEELHRKVYEKLMQAKTLNEARIYPEFAEVKDAAILRGNRSVAVKAIEKHMPLEEFTLAYLKDLYSLMTENEIVAKYGFTNRSLLQWLNEKLNVTKPKTNYHTLVSMTNETKNARIAEFSRQAIFNNPEAQKLRLAKAAEAHRTPEYREKKRQEMIEFYRQHPEVARKVGIISQINWDKCPQIKAALSEYTYNQKGILKRALKDRSVKGKNIETIQQRVIKGYYWRFWNGDNNFKEQYRQARLEGIEELKKKGLIL